MKQTLKNIIMALPLFVVVSTLLAGDVYATEEYGEPVEHSFRVRKEVRIKDEGSYEDKLILDDDEHDAVIEFRIRITNTGDEEVDHMKMEDYLPSEMYRVGGSGLTEYWDDFEAGETKTFHLEAKIKSSEFDDTNFDKCVVNKAEARYDGDYVGSDTATVCYVDNAIQELPETGLLDVALPLGLSVMAFGYVLRRFE